MTETRPEHPLGRHDLGLVGRVSALLTVALLPLGLIAVLQAVQALQLVRDTYQRNLAAQTARAATPETEALLRTVGIAFGLAKTMPDMLAVPEECVALMRRVENEGERVLFAGFIGLDRISTCNNMNQRFDFSDNTDSDSAFEAKETIVTFNASGGASQRAVIIVSEPVRDAAGEFLGFVSISMSSGPLVDARARSQKDPDTTLITFNANGSILTSDIDHEALPSLLPAEIPLTDLAGDGQRVFSAVAQNQTVQQYAVVPIFPNHAYAMSIRRAEEVTLIGDTAVLRSVAFPLLMWLVSLGVAVLAIRGQIIVPVRKLQVQMRNFARERTIFRAGSVASAAREFREIGETFERMAKQIVRDEADLENKVFERDVLLREVHHRVKNNLQLISSIINMQIRQSRTNAEQDALRQVQGRLSSLAKFHQDLYQTSSLLWLRADELLEDLARQMLSLDDLSERPIDLRLDLDKVYMIPDQASPLAMLVTEALTNAIKYASAAPDAPIVVSLSLKQESRDDADIVRVRIVNSLAPDAEQVYSTGLGSKLMRAFAVQLEGDLDQNPTDGGYAVGLCFSRAQPNNAEVATLSGTPRAVTAF